MNYETADEADDRHSNRARIAADAIKARLNETGGMYYGQIAREFKPFERYIDSALDHLTGSGAIRYDKRKPAPNFIRPR